MKNFPYGATILLFVGLVILIKLGLWQIDRLEWKQELLRDIALIEQSDLSKPLDLRSSTEDLQNFKAGTIKGDVLKDEIFLQSGAQKQRYQFLKLENEKVLSVRGDASPIMKGYVRQAQRPNSFVPDNKPPVWYWLDTRALSEELNREVIPLEFIPWSPKEGPLPRPNNNHFHYALFWFSMAGIMIVIYILRFFYKGKD